MLACMRTTLVINDNLFRLAKVKAAETGMTLSAVMNDALRVALTQTPPKELPPYKMLKFGDPNEKWHLTPNDMYEILMDQELESLRRDRDAGA